MTVYSTNGGTGNTATATLVVECHLVLSDETVNSTRTLLSCGTIAIGPALVVAAPGGNLTLRAATRVSLRNGFSVQSGASLKAGIDPTLAGS